MSEATPKIPTPQEVREGMVEDYAANARKAGADVSISDIERIVQADLQVYEAVEREKKAAPAAKPAQPDEREDTAALVAQQKGMELYRRPENEWREDNNPMLAGDPRKVSAKFPAMMARIKRIMEARGNTRQRSLVASLQEVAAPKLARKFVNLFLCYQSPTMPVKGNPFREVGNPRDRARMFLRLVEDICDESTGTMGSWWVK